ncbi:prolyl oligopeptidase family serine peptidase [Candidatus Poribacteria bacterium]|nr:prolyl oligopeptidase family serine peptidase [Candidatus Poribacteria bacterium]
MQFVSTVSLVTCMCIAPLSRESKATCPVAGADNPLVVEIWPGKVPDETYTIGAEKCRMSPELSREQVEVTEPTSFEQRTYEPIDDVDKVSCRPNFAVAVYPGYLKDELARGMKIASTTPPIFLAHGGEDIVSDPEHSVSMYLALKRAGVGAELHIYASATHDFGVRISDHPYSAWTESCVKWLRHQGLLQPPTRQSQSR